MRQLINHLLQTNIDEIISKSLINCHAEGLHSILFIDTPDKRVRLFFADHKHELWRNDPENIISQPMSIAFHPHHCDITMHVIDGKVSNWCVCENPNKNAPGLMFGKFLYHSAIINNDDVHFEQVDETKLLNVGIRNMYKSDTKFMPATSMHTVYVPRFSRAAWFIYEGKEDPNYKPYCYSNCNPNMTISNELYKPATEFDVRTIVDYLKERGAL